MARYTVIGVNKHFRTLRAALDVAHTEAISTGRPVFIRISPKKYIKVTPAGNILNAQRAS